MHKFMQTILIGIVTSLRRSGVGPVAVRGPPARQGYSRDLLSFNPASVVRVAASV